MRLIEDQALRQGLGEIISLIDAQQAEYERIVARLNPTRYPAAAVEFGAGPDGWVTVVDLDLEAAKSEPAFRLQLWQATLAYQDVVGLNELVVKLHKEVLTQLADEGFEPANNWLLIESQIAR